MLDESLQSRIAQATGAAVVSVSPLSGGCVGEVYRAELGGGSAAGARRSVVVKLDRSPAPSLETEAYMLRLLRERSGLPVPGVILGDPDLLVMEFIESGPARDRVAVERHAAELLADLHAQRPPDGRGRFGLERDTLIGSLVQRNTWTASWPDFFRDHRLRFMADEAERAGRLPPALRRRIETLAARTDELLGPPSAPALLHGDIWSGNVLVRNDGIAAFIDPAVSYGHPEIELAFIDLFGTFGAAFHARYRELAALPDPDGYDRVRRDIYNLYPLLVHVRLFGGGYVQQVDSTLRRVGF